MGEASKHPHVTGDTMDVDHAFAEENLPALALGALDEEESARIREHLHRCPRCRAEYLSFENVAAALATSVPLVEPPAHLRHTIRALTTPRSAGSAPPFESRPSAYPFRRVWRSPRLLVTVLLVAALGLLGWNVSLHQRMTALAQETEEMHELGMVLMDYTEHPDAYTSFVLQGRSASPAPRGMVITARTNNRLVLVVEGLPVEFGDMYTVWIIDRRGRRMHVRKIRCDGRGRAVLLMQLPVPVETIGRIRILGEPDGHPLLEGEFPGNQGLPVFMASVAL